MITYKSNIATRSPKDGSTLVTLPRNVANELNFHPVPHGVVTSRGSKFVTKARAMSLQLAAASYIYIHCALKEKRKEQRWWQRQQGSVLRFEFAGRLECSVGQWVV